MSRSIHPPERGTSLAYKRWKKRNLVPKEQVSARYEAKAVVRDELAAIAEAEAEQRKIAHARAKLQQGRDLADPFEDCHDDYWYDGLDDEDRDEQHNWRREYEDYLDGAQLDGADWDGWDDGDYYCPCCDRHDSYEDDYPWFDDRDQDAPVPTPEPPLALADPDLIARGRRAARRVRARRR